MSSGPLKPLARARRGAALLQRTYHVLSRELEEDLFRHADVLSEGHCLSLQGAGETYFGSTMISCELARLQRHFRGGFDDAGRAAFVSAAEGSVRLRLRAMRLACAEVARRVGQRDLGTALTEVRVRLTDMQLYIDVDLEVPLGVSSRTGRQ